MALTIIAFIVILGLVILVHELGHFLVARAFGIKVEEFGIGYPPRLFKVKRGETTYSLNVIPIGGFVKLLGEQQDSEQPCSFTRKKPRIRLAVIVAGVVMNFILAWLLISIGFGIGMTPLVGRPQDFSGAQVETQILVTGVAEGSAAEKAGLKSSDVIIGVPGDKFLTVEELQNYTQAQAGKTVTLQIEREGETKNVETQLVKDSELPLGVSIGELSTVKVPFWRAPIEGAKEMGRTCRLAVIILGRFVKQLFTTGQVPEDVAGPVGIFVLTGIVVKFGWIYILQFVALLSISLAIINIAPFPPLDGSRLLFILIEGVVGKKVVATRIENAINNIGFILLIILIIAVTYQEIFVRPLWRLK